MDLRDRTAILTYERRTDLNCLVESRLDVKPASSKSATIQMTPPVKADSFRVRIKRLAQRLCFSCVTDMLVWYELDFKGPENAKHWRRRVARLDQFKPSDHPGLQYVIEALDLERDGRTGRIRELATRMGRDEEAISRTLRQFANDANIYYSLDWLVFLHAIHYELHRRSSGCIVS
jgi:hypothetical protein